MNILLQGERYGRQHRIATPIIPEAVLDHIAFHTNSTALDRRWPLAYPFGVALLARPKDSGPPRNAKASKQWHTHQLSQESRISSAVELISLVANFAALVAALWVWQLWYDPAIFPWYIIGIVIAFVMGVVLASWPAGSAGLDQCTKLSWVVGVPIGYGLFLGLLIIFLLALKESGAI